MTWNAQRDCALSEKSILYMVTLITTCQHDDGLSWESIVLIGRCSILSFCGMNSDRSFTTHQQRCNYSLDSNNRKFFDIRSLLLYFHILLIIIHSLLIHGCQISSAKSKKKLKTKNIQGSHIYSLSQ